jgi:hypothetical protein
MQEKDTGRANWGEYSKLTGTPIPKNVGPKKSYKPSPEALKVRHEVKQIGRVNAAESKALSEKRRRKAALRKRVAAK